MQAVAEHDAAERQNSVLPFMQDPYGCGEPIDDLRYTLLLIDRSIHPLLPPPPLSGPSSTILSLLRLPCCCLAAAVVSGYMCAKRCVKGLDKSRLRRRAA